MQKLHCSFCVFLKFFLKFSRDTVSVWIKSIDCCNNKLEVSIQALFDVWVQFAQHANNNFIIRNLDDLGSFFLIGVCVCIVNNSILPDKSLVLVIESEAVDDCRSMLHLNWSYLSIFRYQKSVSQASKLLLTPGSIGHDKVYWGTSTILIGWFKASKSHQF